MAEPQFIHIEAYGRVASGGKGGKGRGKANLLGVAQEASRKPSASRHVAQPRKPITILGESPMLVVKRAIREADEAVVSVRKRSPKSGSEVSPDDGLRADGKQGDVADTRPVGGTETRRLRQDALLMVVGVASFPKALKDQDGELYDRWLALTQTYLLDRYGEHLVSVVEHLDEAHPHIHFFLKPDRLADGTYDIGALHPGIKARKLAQANGLSPFVAYQTVMTEFQQDYFQFVGETIGLVQKSVQRARVTRNLALTMRADLELRETGTLDPSTRAGIDKQICKERLQAYQKNIWEQILPEPREAWKDRAQRKRERDLNWHGPDPEGFIPLSPDKAAEALGQFLMRRDQEFPAKKEQTLRAPTPRTAAIPSPDLKAGRGSLPRPEFQFSAAKTPDAVSIFPMNENQKGSKSQKEWLEKASKRAAAIAEIIKTQQANGLPIRFPTEEEIERHILAAEWEASLKLPEPGY